MQPTDLEKAAIERLIAHAQSDTGQSRHVADFLLAWWNAIACGGFVRIPANVTADSD